MTPRLTPLLLGLSCVVVSARAQSTLGALDSVTRRIERHSADSVFLVLRDGDYAKLSLAHHTGLAARVLRPDGSVLRPAADFEDEDDIAFVAEGAGRYTVVVTNGADTAAQYDIAFRQRLSLDQRTAPVWRDPVPSPRIESLRRQIDSGNTNTASLWSSVASEGTPLVEPLDARYDLVTFLWRAAHDTRNVYLRATLGVPTGGGPYDVFHQLGNTDVWYLTLAVPKGARFLYRLEPNRSSDRSMAPVTAQFDPLNRGPKQNCPTPSDTTSYLCQSLGQLPEATPQPWLERRPGVVAGRIERHTIHSALQNVDRDLTVYLPANYAPKGKPGPLVVLFDGDDYLDPSWSGLNTWDNLIAAGKIPPTVVVMVHNLPGRRLFDLVANPTFGEFMAKELVPWVRAHYNVSRAARRTVVGGASAGGFAATYLGLAHPNVFGNVLSMSGAFWWSPEHNGGICGGTCAQPGQDPPVSNRDATTEPNWIAQVALRRRPPMSPVRFYFTVGAFEFDRSGTGAGILEETRHLRDILRAQGSQVIYQQFVAGHDGLGWRGAMADGLLSLLGSTASPTPANAPGSVR